MSTSALSREQPQRDRMLASPEHPDRLRTLTRVQIRRIWNPLSEVVRGRARPLSRREVVPELDRRFRAEHPRPRYLTSAQRASARFVRGLLSKAGQLATTCSVSYKGTHTNSGISRQELARRTSILTPGLGA